LLVHVVNFQQRKRAKSEKARAARYAAAVLPVNGRVFSVKVGNVNTLIG